MPQAMNNAEEATVATIQLSQPREDVPNREYDVGRGR